MISAVHLGAFAALVVLLVPMALAGLHLSLNRLLFFGCALFISLAIAVHVSPFLPISFHVPTAPLPPASCLSLAHRPLFLHRPLPSWRWPPTPAPCRLRLLPPSAASDLLNSSRLLLAGDSQARLLTLQLLALLADNSTLETAREDLFRRHSDYHVSLPGGIAVDFIWAPFESNLTNLILDLKSGSTTSPDLLVMGSGLWHMLHLTNATEYGLQLRALAHAAAGSPPPRMFWLGMPTLVNPMLNTDEKRRRMKAETWAAYSKEVEESGLLRGAGGPFVLLDVGTLSSGCGKRCTEDGMHYMGVVYEVVVQVMLNALLMEPEELRG